MFLIVTRIDYFICFPLSYHIEASVFFTLPQYIANLMGNNPRNISLQEINIADFRREIASTIVWSLGK